MSSKDDQDVEDCSDSQVSRFASFLRRKPSQKSTDGVIDAPKPKSIEEMSILSLITRKGPSWRKESSADHKNFQVRAGAYRRTQKAVNQPNIGHGLAVLAVALIVILAGLFFWNQWSAAKPGYNSNETGDTLDQVLEQLLKN